jgi:hypothetical protein
VELWDGKSINFLQLINSTIPQCHNSEIVELSCRRIHSSQFTNSTIPQLHNVKGILLHPENALIMVVLKLD